MGSVLLHLLGRDFLAVHLEHAGAGLGEAAHVIVEERADAEAFILEVELDGVFAGRERIGAFPFEAFQVDHVPEKHRLAFEQVEAVAGEPATGGKDHAFGTAFGNRDVRGDGVGGVEEQRRIALRQADHRLGIDELGAAGGDVRTRGDDARGDRGVHREDLILAGFLDEELLQLLHLVGEFVGDVLRLAEVLVQVVEFEHLIVERVGIRRAEGLPRRAVHLGAEQPAFVIERILAHHLEILGLVPRRLLGVFRVKGVGETRAFDGCLLDAVHRGGCRDAGDLEDGRHHVNDVHELLAQAAGILDVAGPGNRHALADAAELGGVLLEPGEGRIEGPGPARRHVVVGLLGAPHVIPFQLFGRGDHVHAVEERDFVRRAERTALGARAVVAVDVDDERVVELAHVLDGLDDAPDLVVVVRLVGGEDFHLPDEEFLLVGGELIPRLKDLFAATAPASCPPG